MITPHGELTFGSTYNNNNFDGDLIISKKFIGIKKIVSTPSYFYILVDEAIYYNHVLTDDDFKQTTFENCDNDIKFVDISVTKRTLFALDINSVLYKIIGSVITKLDYNYDDIINIYGGYTDYLIFKNKFDDYHIFVDINNSHDTLFLGNADCIYYTTQGFVLIKCGIISIVYVDMNRDKILILSESYPSISNLLSTLRHNIEYLYQIPFGSYLSFYNHSSKINSLLPIDISDTILYTEFVKGTCVNICVITGNVYDNNFNVLPKLKNLCTSIKYDRGRNIKNANNIANK